jgi:hypothetical protein
MANARKKTQKFPRSQLSNHQIIKSPNYQIKLIPLPGNVDA